MNYSDYILEMILLERNRENKIKKNEYMKNVGEKYFDGVEQTPRIYTSTGRFVLKNKHIKNGKEISNDEYTRSNTKVKEKNGKLYYIYPASIRVGKNGKQSYTPSRVIVRDKETKQLLAEFDPTSYVNRFTKNTPWAKPEPTKSPAQQKPETKKAVETAANVANSQDTPPEQKQQTAEAVAKAQGKQKAKMSTKKKIGIGAASVAGLAIGSKIAYDYAKYKKWKGKEPLRKNVTFKQWKKIYK